MIIPSRHSEMTKNCKNELSEVAFLNTIQNWLRMIQYWFHLYDILEKEGEQMYGGFGVNAKGAM